MERSSDTINSPEILDTNFIGGFIKIVLEENIFNLPNDEKLRQLEEAKRKYLKDLPVEEYPWQIRMITSRRIVGEIETNAWYWNWMGINYGDATKHLIDFQLAAFHMLGYRPSNKSLGD
ncbi:MAG: hypothetical protein Q8P57_04375 [Candidatus Pacearchaeota archaeon]|nr:hypothetical protein [Candidatus Pacearchaeota archaeon]